MKNIINKVKMERTVKELRTLEKKPVSEDTLA